MTYPLMNIVPRPEDNRDLLLSIPVGVIQDLPISKDLRIHAGAVEDQLRTNSCVANATVSALEILLNKAKAPLDLSRLFVYWNCRVNYQNLRGVDEGAYLIDGFKSCYTFGVPEETQWLFNPSEVNTQPPNSVFQSAEAHKVQKYTKVGSYVGVDRSAAIDQTKAALAMGYPVIIAMRVHPDIFGIKGTLDSPSCKYNTLVNSFDEYVGGHAMCLVGYNENGFIVENSWGTSWGDQGFGIIGYEVMNQACFEAWTCTKFNNIEFAPEWNFTNSGKPMTVKLTEFTETQYLNPAFPGSISLPWVNAEVQDGTMPYGLSWTCSDPSVNCYATGKSIIGTADTKWWKEGEVRTIKFECTLTDSSIPEAQQVKVGTLIRVRNSVKPRSIKDIDSNYGKAYRLYRVAFNRIPDEVGLGYWESQLNSGMTLVEFAARCMDSDEFRGMYGSAVTNREFMTLLYRNGLRREADEAGLVWWDDQLTKGLKIKQEVLVGFSESEENRTMTTWW